jgi:hypothetical protein
MNVEQTAQGTADQQFRRVVELMRVLIVGGIPVGVVVVGIGSRLAMFVLRVTSPDRVNGVESDDGFTIGEFTLGGTYNLLQLGAAVGIIGAGAYMLVAPWLIGPRWFRRLTTGLAAGVVGGSMLVHADGIDFTLLKPTWFAIGLFVALPALFGVALPTSVDAVRRPNSWSTLGRRRWLLVVLSIGFFPATILLLPFAAAAVVVCVYVRDVEVVRRVRRVALTSVLIRAVWLLIAVAGLVALVGDIRALT